MSPAHGLRRRLRFPLAALPDHRPAADVRTMQHSGTAGVAGEPTPAAVSPIPAVSSALCGLSPRGFTVTHMPRIGDLVPATTGGWMEFPPERCHGPVLVGWQPCDCGLGHRTWTCRTCGNITRAPEQGPGCRDINADGR